MRHHKYTETQIEFVASNIEGISWEEMTEIFNKKFGTSLKTSQIKSLGKLYGFKNKMRNNNAGWNKGLKWSDETRLKMSIAYRNRVKHPRSKPIGTERERKGYIQVKIGEPRKWKLKHILIWEQHNGELPKGSVVIFADKNNRNFDHKNLIAVTRNELAIMNRFGLIFYDTDSTNAGKTIANIKTALNKIKQRKWVRKRPFKKRNRRSGVKINEKNI